jgi:hypothetical protein
MAFYFKTYWHSLLLISFTCTNLLERVRVSQVNKLQNTIFVLKPSTLKGLSHEIDFKNFDKNLQNLA